MSQVLTKKRGADELEQMHVKGKLKKYAQTLAGPADSTSSGRRADPDFSSDSDNDQDDDDDENIVLTTLPASSDGPSSRRVLLDQDESSHAIIDHEFAEFMRMVGGSKRSSEQFRTEVAFRLERERNRLEGEVKMLRLKQDRGKVFDNMQMRKDQVLLQLVQDNLETRAHLLRSLQFVLAKLVDRL